MAILNSTAGDNTEINVVAHTDSICAPCPNRQAQTCLTEEKITVLDKNHASALQIKPGDTLTWREAKTRIAKQIPMETFHHICATCSWKSYGICEKVLSQHQSGRCHARTLVT